MSDASAAVYVVDDDVSVRESVEGLIHSADFRVETFATARELLDRFRDEVPGCLVLGETGTGKERVAQAIHARSHRSSRPMISLNCAAIQPSLIASELFGHERGAFTGALHQRLGRFELAEGGTIFLDEIGDLPAETQIALLRILQEREFERVGGNQPIRADVRVIAATHCDLRAATAAGSFRNDLYYRLNVFPIHVPPLRERPSDIPLLIEHFLRIQSSKLARGIRGVDEKTLEIMRSYSWPGNVRELQNAIERWAIVSRTAGVLINESWFPREVPPAVTVDHEQAADGTVNFRGYLETVERNLIGRAMMAAGGNQSDAARRLGLSRGSLLERLRKYGRSLPDDRGSDDAVGNRSAPLDEQPELRRSM